jgi:uncharacterized membrane protein YqaE (UPF0057 family)
MKKITILSTAAIALMFSVNVFASSSETTSTEKDAKSSSAETKAFKMDDAVVQDAMLQFKSLSRVEKKEKYAEVKKLMKEYKAQKATGDASTNTVLLAILAILLPPLAVYLHENAINGKFWLSLLLTLLFWIPGVIYALIVVL